MTNCRDAQKFVMEVIREAVLLSRDVFSNAFFKAENDIIITSTRIWEVSMDAPRILMDLKAITITSNAIECAKFEHSVLPTVAKFLIKNEGIFVEDANGVTREAAPQELEELVCIFEQIKNTMEDVMINRLSALLFDCDSDY